MADYRETSEVLALIEKGWDVPNDIRDRAALMRSHAEKNNLNRAMEYAAEIVTLQNALSERRGHSINAMPAYMTKAHLIDWSYALVRGHLAGLESYSMRHHAIAPKASQPIAAE